MNNYQHPKLTNIITLAVIAIVFGLVIWNVWSAYEESIKEYNFPGVKILKPITITAYQYYDNGTDVLVYNQTKPAYIYTTFITTSFSALNPITVKPTLEIRNVNDTQWKGMQDIFVISYPKSYVYNSTGNFHEDAAIVLEKVPNSHTYAGEQTIVFPFAGEYGFAIVDLDDASDIEVRIDGTYTIATAVFTNLDEKIIEKSKIIIEPSISATNVKLAYLAQAFVWILIGIGMLQLRTHLIRGILWIVR